MSWFRSRSPTEYGRVDDWTPVAGQATQDQAAQDQVVRLRVDAGIATITLDSQHNRNALSRQLVGELGERLDEIESTAGIRVIVLTNAGPAFCAGADLKERATGTPDSTPMVRVLERLMDADQPTVAAVDGAVRAGGIGLMASCDLVVVHRSVTFALTEVRIGVAPAIISVPILRRVAPSRIAAAMLTGEPFDADEARVDRTDHARHRRRRGDDRRRCARGSSPGRRGPSPRPSGCSTGCPVSTGRRRSVRCGRSPTSCSAAPTPPRAWPPSARSACQRGMRQGRTTRSVEPLRNCLLQTARRLRLDADRTGSSRQNGLRPIRLRTLTISPTCV